MKYLAELYFKIWVDMIILLKKNYPEGNDWIFNSFVIMTALVGANIAFFLSALFILIGFNLFSYFKECLSFLPGDMLSSLILSLIFLMIPSSVINYVFIFRKQQYLQLLNTYDSKNGILVKSYFFITIGLIFIIAYLNVFFH